MRTAPKTIAKARTLRRWMTSPEDRLWQCLRGRRLGGLKFRRKVPLDGSIVDFYCPAAALIVEISGLGQSREILSRRDAAFLQAGYGLLRARRAEVEDDLDGLLSRIRTSAQRRM